jgi:hypothetical protein
MLTSFSGNDEKMAKKRLFAVILNKWIKRAGFSAFCAGDVRFLFFPIRMLRKMITYRHNFKIICNFVIFLTYFHQARKIAIRLL